MEPVVVVGAGPVGLAAALALRAREVPVAYVEFDGEGHGFRGAETIRRALETELGFYGAVFGFTPADDVPAVDLGA